MWSKFDELTNNHQHSHRIVIMGPSRSGKTSTLFRLAYESCCLGNQVLFICDRNKIESNLPIPLTISSQIESYHYEPSGLSKIDMKYVTNKSDIFQLFATLHCYRPNQPTSIFIDDLSLILTRDFVASHEMGREDKEKQLLRSFKCLSLIEDYLIYRETMATKEGVSFGTPPSKIQFVITESSPDTIDPAYSLLLIRHFSSIIQIAPLLEASKSPSTISDYMLYLTYSKHGWNLPSESTSASDSDSASRSEGTGPSLGTISPLDSDSTPSILTNSHGSFSSIPFYQLKLFPSSSSSSSSASSLNLKEVGEEGDREVGENERHASEERPENENDLRGREYWIQILPPPHHSPPSSLPATR